MRLLLDEMRSPLGRIMLVSDGTALRALDFDDYAPRMHRLLRLHYGGVELGNGTVPQPIRQALEDYFAGDLAAIDAIPVETGGTAFQRQVWAALRDIPAAAPTSYGRLAQRIGRPGASRAVGMANGANPIGIVVPCHRVIGANATLTGYGGGLHRKEWLLGHEARYARPIAGQGAQARLAFSGG